MACAWELQIQFQPSLLLPLINVKCSEIYIRNSVVAILSCVPEAKATFQCWCPGNYPTIPVNSMQPFFVSTQRAAEDSHPTHPCPGGRGQGGHQLLATEFLFQVMQINKLSPSRPSKTQISLSLSTFTQVRWEGEMGSCTFGCGLHTGLYWVL